MTTLNLFHVTDSLKNLLKHNVNRFLELPDVVDITTMPPEDVKGSLTLNLHLYHICEEPHFKNSVGHAGADPAISGQPMALKLFYVLTPHHGQDTEFNAEEQQRIMGLAMKTFHDFPVITDTTDVGSGQVFVEDFRDSGNRIEIILRPLKPEEAINFWSSEESKTPRLSAYYEVRVIFLEPEVPKRSIGTVFDVGLYVKSNAIARVESSESVLNFTPPAETGLGAQSVAVSPARITLEAVGLSVVTITGQNLTSGHHQAIRLRHGNWNKPITIDPGLNPTWAVTIDTGSARFTPQSQLIDDDGTPFTVSPGSYEASLVIVNQRDQGSIVLETEYETSRTTISIGPHIIAPLPAPPIATPGFDLELSVALETSDPDNTSLAIDGEIYTFDAALTNGSYRFNPALNILQISPLASLVRTGVYRVQLVINGGESQPFWVNFA